MAKKIERKQLKHIEKRLKELYDRGVKALVQKNYGYAIDMFRTVLYDEPGLLEVRQKLREAQLGRVGNKPSMARAVLAFFVTLPARAKAKVAIRAGNFSKALDQAEVVMTGDPTSPSAALFMAGIAADANVWDVAINALDCALAHHLQSIPLLHRLANAYVKGDEALKGLECMNRICGIKPTDKFMAERKEMTALAAMKQGGWAAAEQGKADYKDIIRDKDQAVKQEQEGSTFRTSADMEMQIKSLQQLVDGRDSGANRQKLAEAYRQAGRDEEAIVEYEKALEMLDGFDPGLYNHVTECKGKVIDKEITSWKEALANEVATEAEAIENIKAWEDERLTIMLDRWGELVKRLPSEVKGRDTLAHYQFEAGEYDLALANFQMVKKNPALRQQASLTIGRCLSFQGKHDLAIVELEGALEGMHNMDGIKKSTLYQLAEEYKVRGDQEKADSYFKEVYSADIGFRDVSEIVEKIYSRESSGKEEVD
ncbi:MAG TPA: hypothetical protein DCR55_13680 [Lentisphaeria bacterium]|nr:hypothetical protein [Lentisphaeria bacterium]